MKKLFLAAALYALGAVGCAKGTVNEQIYDTDASTDTDTDTWDDTDTGSDTSSDTETESDTSCEGIDTPQIEYIQADSLEGRVEELFSVTVKTATAADGVNLSLFDVFSPYNPDVVCSHISGNEYDCSFIPDKPGFYFDSIIAGAYNFCTDSTNIVHSEPMILEEDVLIYDRCVDRVHESVDELYEGQETAGIYVVDGPDWKSYVVGNMDQCTSLDPDVYDSIETCYHSTINPEDDPGRDKTFETVVLFEADTFSAVSYEVYRDQSGYFFSIASGGSTGGSFLEKIYITSDDLADLINCDPIENNI